MQTPEKRRVVQYLERRYGNLTSKRQKEILSLIINRLANKPDYLDVEALEEIVRSLREEQKWPIEKVIAHLDALDIEDRT